MPEPNVTILDVGHGNCAVLVDDKVVVIDAGPGTTLLDFLEEEGIKEVAVVLISHADEDHIKGLVSLFESQTVLVQLVRINSDGIKNSPTWNDLMYLLDEANKAGRVRFEVGLTTIRRVPSTLDEFASRFWPQHLGWLPKVREATTTRAEN